MTTVFQRLLEYPHRAVFEKSSDPALAFRLQHGSGASWTVADGVLTARRGSQSFTYQLASFTLQQLAIALQGNGFQVSDLSTVLQSRSALVLAEGSGSQATSNGDRLNAFGSLLWVLMSAYGVALRDAGAQVPEALKQMVIPTSGGEWLDLWGALYAEQRRQGESDSSYAPRIPQEAFRLRVNALAIEKAIFDITGKDVRIEEPWELIFRLDESMLSGTSRLYDGSSVGYHLIRPVSYVPILWDDVLPVIERNRGAGIVVLPPEVRIRTLIDGRVAGTVWTGHSGLITTDLPAWKSNRLDYMVLSGEDIVTNNSCITEERFFVETAPASPVSVVTLSSELTGFTWDEVGGWIEFPWSVTPMEIEGLITAIEGLYEYSTETLPSDLG